MRVAVDAPGDGFLLLADTYYPGWTATVDGQAAPLYRANLSVRAVPISAGRHDVVFSYEPPGVRRGVLLSSAGAGLLLLWVIAAAGFAGSARSRRPA